MGGWASFSNRFPSLYRISSLKNALISAFYSFDRENNVSWNCHFSTDPSEREMGEVLDLLGCLEGVSLSVNLYDRWVWDLEGQRLFSCKSFFNFLIDDHTLPVFKFSHFIWKALVPTKVQVFNWLLVSSKHNTQFVTKKETFLISVSRVVRPLQNRWRNFRPLTLSLFSVHSLSNPGRFSFSLGDPKLGCGHP